MRKQESRPVDEAALLISELTPVSDAITGAEDVTPNEVSIQLVDTSTLDGYAVTPVLSERRAKREDLSKNPIWDIVAGSASAITAEFRRGRISHG